MTEEYPAHEYDAWLDSLHKDRRPELLFTNFICGAANKYRDPADGKFCKNSHQYRLKAAMIVAVREILENAGLDSLTTFGEILSRVTDLTRTTSGFGSLACYDFTLRYAWWRHIRPEVVYLHAGAATGLKWLMRSEAGKGIVVLADSNLGRYVEAGTLPASVARLGNHQIENFLCVYHANLKRFATLHPATDKTGAGNGKKRKSKKSRQ